MIDRTAVDRAVRAMVARERARVDDPGAAILGADPDDGHGWHSWTPDAPAHPRHPGMPYFHPDCWRFFRLLDLLWLGDDLLVAFAWDELGTPDLRYLTRIGFMASHVPYGPGNLALTVRGHLRLLLAPTEAAVTSLHRDPTAGPGWRERCGRLWLDRQHVVVTPGDTPDQARLDVHWELPWASLTNPPAGTDQKPR